MYLIVGLGNPEEQYKNTRHNIGFEVIDQFAKKNEIEIKRKDFEGEYAKFEIDNKKVIILKPTTYMNLSGRSVRQIVDFFKIDIEKIIVIYDDVDIELGKMRIRKNGSSGSHNGIKSIIECLGTSEFARIRVGIGKPKYDMINHVLGKFEEEEMEVIKEVIEKASEASKLIVTENLNTAMNKFN